VNYDNVISLSAFGCDEEYYLGFVFPCIGILFYFRLVGFAAAEVFTAFIFIEVITGVIFLSKQILLKY
jgi:hypothetical protein